MEETKIYWDENQTTLHVDLAGHIDSLTSKTLQKQLKQAVEGREKKALVMDAENLGYISSAGIRIIVDLRQQFEDMKIVRVSREIYDIFSMTGVTNMLPVERSIHEIKKPAETELLAREEDGAIYHYSAEQDVKLFDPEISPDEVMHRWKLSRIAVSQGIPTPIAFDVVACEDRYGIVYQHTDGVTLADVFEERPDDMEEELTMLAKLLDKLHHSTLEEGVLPDAAERMLSELKEENALSEEDRMALIRLVQSLKRQDTFVVGSLRLGNVLLQNGRLLLLDLTRCGRGNPVIDLQLTASAMNADGHGKVWDQLLSRYMEKKNPEMKTRLEAVLRPGIRPWWQSAGRIKDKGEGTKAMGSLYRFTGIGEENEAAFSYFLPDHLSPETARIGVIEGNRAAGVAAVYAEGDVLVIEWLYVPEALRRRGIGSALMTRLKELALACNSKALQAELPDSDTKLKQFLEKRGAVFTEEGKYYKIPLSTFTESKTVEKLATRMQKAPESNNTVMPLSELSFIQLRILNLLLQNKGPGGGLLSEGAYDRELSFAVFDEQAVQPLGVLLAQRVEKELFIHYLANFSGDPVVLIRLLSMLKHKITEEEAGKTELVFVGNKNSTDLAEKLAGAALKPAGTCWHTRIDL